MLAQAMPTASLSQAVAALRRAVPTRYSEAVSHLEEMQASLAPMRILFEIAPTKLNDLLAEAGDFMELAAGGRGREQVVQEALNAVDEIAPLDLDHIEMAMQDDENLPWLVPMPHGFPMNWDDWYFMFEELESGDYDEQALFLFFGVLGLRESDNFKALAQHFCWKMRTPNFKNIDHMDWQRMFRKLSARGWGCFNTAWEICAYETGNIYFDYNPLDDNDIPSLPPFTIQGVRFLAEEWKKAQPILKAYGEAVDLFNQEGVPEQLYKIYASCWVRGGNDRRPQTLAELWGGTENEGDDHEIVDPFYGPLTYSLEDEQAEEAEDGNEF